LTLILFIFYERKETPESLMSELFRQNAAPLFLSVLRALGWKAENLRFVRRFVSARRIALPRRVFCELKFERV
jgi:hypothetical protein